MTFLGTDHLPCEGGRVFLKLSNFDMYPPPTAHILTYSTPSFNICPLLRPMWPLIYSAPPPSRSKWLVFISYKGGGSFLPPLLFDFIYLKNGNRYMKFTHFSYKPNLRIFVQFQGHRSIRLKNIKILVKVKVKETLRNRLNPIYICEIFRIRCYLS